jgi:hypothetical protein
VDTGELEYCDMPQHDDISLLLFHFAR